MSVNNFSALVKSIILSVALFLESYFLTYLMNQYALIQDFFSPPVSMVLLLGTGLLLVAYTYALTVGAWKTWEQVAMVSVPVTLGIFLKTMQTNFGYALLLSLVCFLLITYDVYFATGMKKQMVTFNPRLILRFSTRGLLFIFAVTGGALILMEPANKNIDLTALIAKEVGEQAEKIILHSATFQPLNSYGLGNLVDIEGIVEKEVNAYVSSYRDFILPLLAFVTLGFIQFLNFLVYVIFSITIGILFKLAKATGFFHVEKETIEREVLKF